MEDYRHNPSFGSIILEDLYTSSGRIIILPIGGYLHILTFLSEEQVTLLTQQIQVLQNQLSAQSPSPPVDPPPLPTTTKLLKIATPTPFTGLQDDLDCFKAECSLYICL